MTRTKASRRVFEKSDLGFVSLVGAGPGDPELLTYRAIERLRTADLVLHDGLVPRAVLKLASSAECVSVSKRVGGRTRTQAAVTEMIIAGARRGLNVVRLKAGDPFVLGRGGEEVLALADAGIPFEIVPGVSSATAAPALAGIPVTHRGISSGFVVVSGHAPAAYGPLLGALPPGVATVVVLMGLGERAGIAARLVTAGWRRETPAAIVTSASQPSQRLWTGTLETLRSAEIAPRREEPGVIIIGDVVALAAHASVALPTTSTEENPWPLMTIPRL
jgi:uroporphyrin-III C-methyltransferase/precorrin-2 dehydrogenase/sirohydrochlorin ferrochelatase